MRRHPRQSRRRTSRRVTMTVIATLLLASWVWFQIVILPALLSLSHGGETHSALELSLRQSVDIPEDHTSTKSDKTSAVAGGDDGDVGAVPVVGGLSACLLVKDDNWYAVAGV